jgi:hypothetical protein
MQAGVAQGGLIYPVLFSLCQLNAYIGQFKNRTTPPTTSGMTTGSATNVFSLQLVCTEPLPPQQTVVQFYIQATSVPVLPALSITLETCHYAAQPASTPEPSLFTS